MDQNQTAENQASTPTDTLNPDILRSEAIVDKSTMAPEDDNTSSAVWSSGVQKPSIDWKTRAVIDPTQADMLTNGLKLSPKIARMLISRGIASIDAAREFLSPSLKSLRSPTSMHGVSEAIERIKHAIQNNETIAVFGDYDVDGITSTAISYQLLKHYSSNVKPFIAKRSDGYGFPQILAKQIADERASLVILHDCGTHDEESIIYLKDRGVDVIAIDHHGVYEDFNWPGYALINPKQPVCEYPFKGLCSASLAFLFCVGLKRALDAASVNTIDGTNPQVVHSLDLAALGILADVAPLKNENRILVREGMKMISRNPRPGIHALIKIASPSRRAKISTTDVLWKIAPRLNAPGRMGEALPAFQTLCEEDETQAMNYAMLCERQNQLRREVQERMLAEANEEASRFEEHQVLVVARENWHPGVVGIIAARLAQIHRKPSIVLSMEQSTGLSRGSGRSFGNEHITELIAESADILEKFGGHRAAAGMTIKTDKIDQFRTQINSALGSDYVNTKQPITVDCEVRVSELDERLLEDIERLAPFGQENPEPTFFTSGIRVRSAKVVGTKHLSLLFSLPNDHPNQVSGIIFSHQDKKVYASNGETVDIVYRLRRDHYRGGLSLHIDRLAQTLSA